MAMMTEEEFIEKANQRTIYATAWT